MIQNFPDSQILPGTATESPAEAPIFFEYTERYTLDGDASLEKHLKTICDWVRDGLIERVPKAKLVAIVLGGGYGRGEGGVLRSASGDMPYNDMEFYVYLLGNPLLNEFRYRSVLQELEHELSEKAQLEVEFKLQSLAHTERTEVSMFSYDLVMGHHIVQGSRTLYEHCGHHRDPGRIPFSELTRLLMNRCSGLLFAKQRLEAPHFTSGDADFVARNLAKLRLALGDVVLGESGEYHWSCRERARRLENKSAQSGEAWLEAVQSEYCRGMQFKLHPRQSNATRRQLQEEFLSLSELAGKVWLWLEALRLKRPYEDFADYAFANENKCPQSNSLKNLLINWREFGFAGVRSNSRFSYPRERMLRTLPMLLWAKHSSSDPNIERLFEEQLCGGRGEITDSIDAYERLWRRFR